MLTSSNYIAVIQAGGMGSRLYPLTHDEIPKPLLPMNGKPMMEWQIDCLKRYGIKEYIIVVGHLGDKIKDYFGNGSRFDVSISYFDETEPLGSAGALCCLRERLRDRNFFLIYADVMFDIDLPRMICFHENKDALATILVHPNAHPYDSDLVLMDDDARVTGFDGRNNKRDYWYDNIVNAGVHILSGTLLEKMGNPKRMALEKDLLEPLVSSGRIYGYRTTEYVRDAGTVDRFHTVGNEQKAGIWASRNLARPQKCIFLDRDGTINQYKSLIANEDGFVLEKNAAEAIRMINQSGYLAIAVTNQPVVARGMCSIEDVRNIHKKMAVLLGRERAYLDDVIFCPHHPDKGYPEENPKYKTECQCRKPKSGMIDEMARKYNIDLSMSWIVGDSTVDIQTGINAGLKTVLVATGQCGEDGKYDVRAEIQAIDILDAVCKILDR